MSKIEEIVETRRQAHQRLLDLDEAAFSAGHLPVKIKELIAVGISVVTDCESCMEWHIRKAARAGATVEEMVDTLGVAMEIGGGRATVSARFALEAMDHVFERSSEF